MGNGSCAVTPTVQMGRRPVDARVSQLFFSDFNKARSGNIWFALDASRRLACIARISTSWTSVRKVREGETTDDLYGFLTTDANAFMKPIHPKAMT
jgi:putative SOS response-associated peptidase YedK